MKSYRQKQAKADSPVSQSTRKKRRERNRARHAQYRIRYKIDDFERENVNASK